MDDQTLGGRLADVDAEVDPLDRQAVLAKVQRSLFANAEDPVRIGRFVVIERLGTGASGVVYAAYDPQLDRKVALKLLRSDADLPTEAHSRLLREAQSMARLSHPHVVAVHDVGDVDGRVFIAMELLRGGTLRRYVESKPRRVADLLAIFGQAGEGLAAAHAVGLVHRDFKPDNVLLDRRGRARVLDFGLAADHGDPGMSMMEAVITGEVPRLELDRHLTQTGAVMGTPAYMAPEQFAGRPADARTDQYAFCVALYEALYGERPFDGQTLPALAAAAERGEVRPPPPGRAVPARIRRALLRGLRPDPAERFEDMPALLAALRHDPAARWRRLGLWTVGLWAVLGLGLGTTWLAMGGGRTAEAEPCSGFEQRLRGIWDDDRRQALEAHLLESDLGADAPVDDGLDRAGAWSRVEPGLTEIAEAWVQARAEACEATKVRQEQSAELLDRRVLCLDRALLELAAAADRLGQADVETIARAVELVPPRAVVDDCSAVGVLDDGDPPPADPQLRERIAALEERIATADSLLLAGKYTEGLEESRAIVRDLSGLSHPPTEARALMELGAALTHNRQVPEAIEVLVQALVEAEAGRADRTRALVTHLLTRRLADTGQFDEARRLAAVTEALYSRLAHPLAGSPARAQILWGNVEWSQGRYDEAIARFDRAIELTEGSDDPELRVLYSEALSHRGSVALEAYRPADARPFLQRSLELRREQAGPDHPELAIVMASLGTVEIRLGNLPHAEQLLRRSLKIRERRFGPDHGSLAPTLSNLGAVLIQRGDHQGGLALQERSLALMERSLGTDNPELAIPLHNLALVYLRTGQPDRARTAVRRAMALREATLGPDHARTIESVYQVAFIDDRTGHDEQAGEGYARYVALLRQHRPQEHAFIVQGLIGVAGVALDQGQPQKAQRAMEQAQVLLDTPSDKASGEARIHELRAAVDFALARAIHQTGRSPLRARQLAEQALSHAEALPPADPKREQIERWLAEHEDPADR